MKTYYLFSNNDSSLKIDLKDNVYKFSIDGKLNPEYDKKELLEKLKDFINRVEKYDK